jgi:hypothetical protein
MADIVLAQLGVRTWLVGGEALIDDLLANTLPPHVTIDFVACQSQSEVEALWLANTADPEEYGMPWLIHPAIAERCRKPAAGAGLYPVTFAPWSAMRDAGSEDAVAAAAREALADAAKTVALHWHVAAGAPALAAELGSLRCGLLEAELAAKGVPAERIGRLRGDDAGVADRIDIRVAAAG